MVKEEILSVLRKWSGHEFVALVPRGNEAIEAAVAVAAGKILIPEEGGWLSYQKYPHETVKCNDAKIDLVDLEQKLASKKFKALLYHHPGGYFAQQPIKEIYALGQKYNCLVIMDVCGSLGTELFVPGYADILVGSFRKWKLVNAGVGGFISGDQELFNKIEVEEFTDEEGLKLILEKIEKLPERIEFLNRKRKKIIADLKDFEIVFPNEGGFVVIVRFSDDVEKERKKAIARFELSQKERIINYCENNELPWTECPRYIRLNKKAISIEVKRL